VSSTEEQFTEFATLAAPRLRRTAFLLCGDWHTAEDLAQTALARVFVSWRRINRKGAVHAYATRTLVNSYLAGRRRKRAGEVLLGRLPDRAVQPPGPELRLVLLDALATLPPRARAVVVLRYWEDLSIEQVAALLGCSAGNVKSQSARALDKLRALLDGTALDGSVLAGTAAMPGPPGSPGAKPRSQHRLAQQPSAQTRGARHG
jgi:RNA polymerase sigma-70 factor (sigma-E family)